MLFLMTEANFVHCDIFLQGKYSFIFYFTIFCLVFREEEKTQCKKTLFYIMIPFEKLLWVVEIKQ